MKTRKTPSSVSRRYFLSLTGVGLAALATRPLFAADAPRNDGKLRIICFGAHPDDCELQASGTGALWAAKGHHVKFVSVTNGDIGHWREAGGPLALRRKQEVEKADGMLGITVEEIGRASCRERV